MLNLVKEIHPMLSTRKKRTVIDKKFADIIRRSRLEYHENYVKLPIITRKHSQKDTS